jgi:vibriolysin
MPGTSGDALRYMNDPKLDGASLDYYTSSSGSVDVHYSSGIPNLVFYLLSQGGTHPRGKSTVNVTGIGIAKAAQIFYKANTSIFTSQSTFAAAKTATVQAATQLGYTAAEIASVTAAWAAVGVGSVVTPPATTVVLTNNVAKTGLSGSTGAQALYSLVVPTGATTLKFTTTGGTGDMDLYVRFGSAPTTTTYTCKSEGATSAETCTITGIQAGTYYVMLSAYTAYSGVSLTGAYTTGTTPPPTTCTHSKCVTGVKLVSGCDACVTQICAADSYCCNTSWDATCVGEVASVCGLSCN